MSVTPKSASGRPVAWTLRRPRVDRAWGRVACGIALIVFILFGQHVFGMATASGRLDPALQGASGPRNVVVVLDFTPERFHNERIAEYGVFAGRDKAINRIRLRFVSPTNLRRLAAIPWVARIEAMP
jgi:hypothetical protein